MRQLASRALLISEGSLVIGDERGVAEIGVVADALNEAIQTLGRFEQQADALGRGEFTHSSLQTMLPGRLGQSLSRSVQQVAQLQAHLQHEASHDALTSLINRGAGIRMIEEALERATKLQERISVIFIDLDDFKETNDRHGHHAGDSILTACAERLSGQMTERDRLCRLGGDEFVVVSAPSRSPGDTSLFARALMVRMNEPLTVGALVLRPGASVGVAFSSPDETTADLLARTDRAVHRAKDLGRGRIEIFDEKMRRELEAELRMDVALRTAVACDQFELHYQPVVDTKTGQLKSLEALLRWEMPGEGRIGPDRFIVVAEQTDLILDIDRWVLDGVCRQLAEWADHPIMKSVAVALNISGRHLGRGRLVPDVERAVAAHGIDPKRLVIEITETALMRNEAEVATELERLRQRGIRISLDDFGTGYTSIRQLGEMPIDSIKIDRSFMLDTTELAAAGGLVALICGVAHRMGLSVVAEGVEEPEQLRHLQTLGCERTQGWLVCKALPADNLVTWATSHQQSLSAAARRAGPAAPAAPATPERPNLQVVSGW
jgi:diguanylate cyclase (GGDEF)-like protein